MQDKLKVAIEAAKEAGALTLKYYGGKGEIIDKRDESSVTDGDFNPLTQADTEADTCLKDILRQAFPTCGWLSEETVDSPERLDKEAVWIVDPIDGTREFVQGIPEYVISIALVEAGEPTLGVIYNPATEVIYSGVKDGGTFVNGQRTFCTETPSLDQATLIVSRSETKRGEIDPFLPHLKKVDPIGSVAYKLAVVAAGGADLNISVQAKNEWDVCAGDLLVREAGGKMTNLQGQVRRYNQKDPLIRGGLVAGPAQLADPMLQLIAKAS